MDNVLIKLRQKVDRALAEKTFLEEEITTRTNDLEKSRLKLDASLKAREVITLVAKNTQEDLERQLSSLVTMCLAAVFPDPYGFKVRFEERRNTIEADLLFTKGEAEYKPIDSSGGGVLDVASFGLRIGLWSLNTTRPTFVLDEPFKHVSPDLHDKVSLLCKELCDELGIQIIMVSHSDNIVAYADKVFVVENGIVTEE